MGDCTSTLQGQDMVRRVSSDDIFAAHDWCLSLAKECGVDSVDNLSVDMLFQKDIAFLAPFLHRGANHVSKLFSICKQISASYDNSRSQLIKCQQTVVELQKQLLDTKHELVVAKDEQVASVTATVAASVNEVKEEVKGYSAAVMSGNGEAGATISQTVVKTAVRSVLVDRADEVGREANVVIFGLNEEEGEKVGEKVSELFAALGEKPKFEAKRVGGVKQGTAGRPVKVVLRNNMIARQIVGKASNLREVEKFRGVFVNPDRTASQREERRVLVTELKRRRAEEPGKRHYIRGANVETVH